MEMTSEVPLCVVEVGAELRAGGQIQVRAELSDGGALQLIRTDVDLARMMKRLVDGFPDDRDTLSRRLLPGLLAVRAADHSSQPDIKVVELNRLLKTVINLPRKFSQSEAVQDFFEPSAVDQIARQEQVKTVIQEEEEEVHTSRQEGAPPAEREEVQTDTQEEVGAFRQEEVLSVIQEEEQDTQELGVLQSPLSEVLMSNGFCLANTETILYDLTPTTQTPKQAEDSGGRRDDGQTGQEEQLQTESGSAPLTSHLLLDLTQETDILV